MPLIHLCPCKDSTNMLTYLLLLAVPVMVAGNYEPEQIHLSLGESTQLEEPKECRVDDLDEGMDVSCLERNDFYLPSLLIKKPEYLDRTLKKAEKRNGVDEMTVMWSTRDNPGESVVQYGTSKSNLSQQAVGTFTKLANQKCLIDILIFRAFCYETIYQYVHKVTIKNLESNTKYYYRCGASKNWSQLYNFTTFPNGNDWTVKLILFGDLGKDSEATDYLIKESKSGEWKLFFHNGDLAYNLETDGGYTGDTFLKQIQPIAAYYPYMVSVGNHESYENFTNYKIRFGMPGGADNMFYTYKMGSVLFVVVSTEAYYEYGEEVQKNQRIWLEKTLKEANKRENRVSTPWIVVCGHRPMYCSTTIADMCPDTALQSGFEDLFYKYGVDVVFWGHEHDYERMFPIYDGKVMKGDKSPYVNPKAPVHFISGAAGNVRGQFFFLTTQPDYVAYRSRDVGYTRLTFYNATDLYVEQVSTDQEGKVIDKVFIHKDKHGSYV